MKEKKITASQHKLSFKTSDIQLDDRNANLHNSYGMGQLEKSIEQNGVIEAVTISNDNVAISGNARTEKFVLKGMDDCILVESDGTKPVIIKRTDIKSKTKAFYNAALAANLVAKDNIIMDADVTDAICEEYEIEDWKEFKHEDEHGYENSDLKQPDNSITKEYKENKYPLSIVLSKPEMMQFDKIKNKLKVSEDTTALLRLLKMFEEND